jgi:hypothetical protein
MTSSAADHRELAERRRESQRVVEHIRFLAETLVDRALVKDALLKGLSRSEVAELLGMSEETVSGHCVPYTGYAVARDSRSDDRIEFGSAFLTYVWGSVEAARASLERSVEYDWKYLTTISG